MGLGSAVIRTTGLFRLITVHVGLCHFLGLSQEMTQKSRRVDSASPVIEGDDHAVFHPVDECDTGRRIFHNFNSDRTSRAGLFFA
jgi:hypothetical protein